jgi:NAD:arginine ADP-ribosyltransferase
MDTDRVRGPEFLDALGRLIGADETTRCLGKICNLEALDHIFHVEITNIEALAAYIYSTANGWHSYINKQLWSGSPSSDVAAFAQVLNSTLSKMAAIAGRSATVYRGYNTRDLDAFSAPYVQDEIVTFPAFTSASFSLEGAFGGNVLFIIRALSARAIWWLSPNFHEEEALLPTDCSFRVVDKEFQSVGTEHVKLVIVLQETTKRP